MRMIPYTVALFALATASLQAQTDCRIWNQFIKGGKNNTLLDFSYAGYHHSEKAIPDVQHRVFNVQDYGAIPNDQVSDRDAFVQAIAAAEQHGSGVVFFPKGRYLLHTFDQPTEPIEITRGNIVLRGEGCGIGGTEIFMQQPLRAPNPAELWTSPVLITFNGCAYSPKITPVKADAAKGEHTIWVEDASSLREGEWVCLRLSDNSPELIDKELHPYAVGENWSNMRYNGLQVYDYHLITKIKGNRITFKEPLMNAIDSDYRWYLQRYPHIEEVGVEDIAFVGDFQEKFVHHKDDIHDGGWKLIEFVSTTNSWLRRCRFTDVSSAFSMRSSANLTVYDCKITGNTGHHAIHADASSRVFIGATSDDAAQWHSVGVTKHVLGTVIWRNHTDIKSSFECHASQPRATLLDCCEGAFKWGRAGGAIQNNPNHMADLVFWNYKELDEPETNYEFWPSHMEYWRFLPPTIVGLHGAGTTFKEEQVGYIESLGQPVQPTSLFEAQLAHRLGSLPSFIGDMKRIAQEQSFSGQLPRYRAYEVKDCAGLVQVVAQAHAGDSILLADGVYEDVDLQVLQSGSFHQPLSIMAVHPGKAVITGSSRVNLQGDHVTIKGIVFRNTSLLGDALLLTQGDYTVLSACVFEEIQAPQAAVIDVTEGARYTTISRCVFVDNQAANIIRLQGDTETPMCHHLAHNYFSNPALEGLTAVGGIQVGQGGIGQCYIHDNLFERQDLGSQILELRADQNVIYNNTFLNCQADVDLTDSHQQVLLNNYFLGLDDQHPYGTLLVGGQDHVIGSNFFHLTASLLQPAALNLDSKTRSTLIVQNSFANTSESELHFSSPFLQQDIQIIGNTFLTEYPRSQKLMNLNASQAASLQWEGNTYNGMPSGVELALKGLTHDERPYLRFDDSKVYVENLPMMPWKQVLPYLPYVRMNGIDLDFRPIIQHGNALSPATHSAVGPKWYKSYPDRISTLPKHKH